MTHLAVLSFWLALVLILYTAAGYALVLRIWAALRPAAGREPKPAGRGAANGSPPFVSVLLAVHDEEARIEPRLENLLALDYPRDRLEILVGSDGSADGTARRAARFGAAGVRVLAFPERRGKAAVLADLAPRARGGILVFADARQRFEPGALRELVRPFADPRVGAVSGALILEPDRAAGPAAEGVAAYWSRETAIRELESRIDSVVGATGAIYAIRAHLFPDLPPDTVLDDVLIPLRIVRRGYRVVFQGSARAHDRPPRGGREELRRKTRTIAGNFQLFRREPWLLHPARNRIWFQTVSHKGLRLLLPLPVGVLLAASLALADRPLYGAALLAQAAFYAAALAGAFLGRSGRAWRLFSGPYAVCLLLCATLLAFLRVLGGRQPAAWERAAA
jgi:cellulose synthase/poly-beta-1,6-N-acetylglucosamine synthase-like glycosyltransferase